MEIPARRAIGDVSRRDRKGELEQERSLEREWCEFWGVIFGEQLAAWGKCTGTSP